MSINNILVKPQTIEDLKEIQAKVLFSRTDRVTKITDGSVINGLLYANAKTGQKAIKDIALSQSHFFPDTTYGEYLDSIAELFGVAPRFGVSASTTYIRVHATPSTIYNSGTVVTGSHGIRFDLQETKTVGAVGFTYIKVLSEISGSIANVEDLTLNNMISPPVGHLYVINDFIASGGRDIEDDDAFRERIKNSKNLGSSGTIAKLEQVFMKFNENVLRLFNYGTNGVGKIVLGVLTQNGADLTPLEFDFLYDSVNKYLSAPELAPDGLDFIGISLQNITWNPIDISCRLKLLSGYVASSVRTEVQLRLNRYIDYRFWKSGQKVEWDELLQIVKSTEGVEYVLDDYFVPNADVLIDINKLPRIRGFEMRDIDGTILSSVSGTLNPIYYPNSLDFNYITSVLSDL